MQSAIRKIPLYAGGKAARGREAVVGVLQSSVLVCIVYSRYDILLRSCRLPPPYITTRSSLEGPILCAARGEPRVTTNDSLVTFEINQMARARRYGVSLGLEMYRSLHPVFRHGPRRYTRST